MRCRKRWAALLPLLAVAALIWPISWGGRLGYVTTHGISMEPRFHTGDLAVVRPQRSYRIGEVTAYHNRMLHTVVLHRIVAVQGGRYTFKGDNNSWLDAQRPTGDQLIGSLVLRVPQGGLWLRRLTSSPVVGMVTFAIVAAGGVRRGRRQGRMSRHAAPRYRPRGARRPGHRIVARELVASAVVLLIGTLTGVTWFLPTTQVRRQSVPSPQTMTLSYTAVVRHSAAYDGSVVTAPQPVFRKVTDVVTLRASYRGTPGLLRVDAQLSTPGGWVSTVALSPPRTFTGTGYSLEVPVRLSGLDRRAQAAGRVTGLPTTPVTVTISPTVTDRDGHVFAPEFALTLTSLALATPADASRLTVTAAGTKTEMTPSPATLRVLRHTITVIRARRLTLVASVLAIIALGAVLGAGRIGRAHDEARQIQRRWRALLLDVQPMPTPPGRPVVDVPAFSALARLAQRYDLLVLHWARSGVHTYVVQDDSTIFRYRTRTPDPPTSGPDAEIPPPHRDPQRCERNM